MQVLLLAATLALQPLPLKHQLWVQAAEVRSALQRMSRQPASAACCAFVGAARRALDILVADGAPLQPTPLGPTPAASGQAARCCCMAHAWLLLAIGALLPAALTLARSQRAAAQAAACQAAMLRKPCKSSRSSTTSVRRQGSPEGSDSESLSGNSSPEGRLRSVAAGSSLLPRGRPASSPASSGGTIGTSSLEALVRASSEASLPSIAPSWAAASRSASSGAALDGGSCDPGGSCGPASLPASLRSSPEGGSPDSPASSALSGGLCLAALPAALLAAPLPLGHVQCLLLLLPAGAALWAALEIALNIGQS